MKYTRVHPGSLLVGDTWAQPRERGGRPLPCLLAPSPLGLCRFVSLLFLLGQCKTNGLIVIFFLMGSENMDVFILQSLFPLNNHALKMFDICN